MMKKLVYATHNHGKLKEAKAILPYEVLSPEQWSPEPVEETGLTYVENSLLKARDATQHCQLPAIGDDSGLEIDALGGKPGLYSARFAGSPNFSDNITKVLKALEGVPEQKRTARFRIVLTFLRSPEDPAPLICEATWEGFIAFKPQGTKNFGYDPIFIDADSGQCAGEMPENVKNKISHRAQALMQIAALLKNRLLH